MVNKKTMENYIFKECDAQSIIHLINQYGKDLIGLELGVATAISFCSLLQNCPNIKTLYGVDKWEPYLDYIKPVYDGKVKIDFNKNQAQMEYWRFLAYHSIKFSGQSQKAIILEKDSNEALKDIPDNHLDFIFLDAHLTYEQIVNDLRVWYPKVKTGGLYMGHDWDCDAVRKAVLDFREENNIKSHMSIFDKTFVWKKE